LHCKPLCSRFAFFVGRFFAAVRFIIECVCVLTTPHNVNQVSWLKVVLHLLSYYSLSVNAFGDSVLRACGSDLDHNSFILQQICECLGDRVLRGMLAVMQIINTSTSLYEFYCVSIDWQACISTAGLLTLMLDMVKMNGWSPEGDVVRDSECFHTVA
jgi:hypothetical protein